jgi:prefoldin subunit 5
MEKTFWIGDDGDNKSVKIGKGLFGRGDEIPAGDVAPELLKEWGDKGLISVGAKAAPVVIQDTETIKALEAEIRVLKTDIDRLPGLQREVTELKAALEKAKTGKKAERVKTLEAKIVDLEKDALEYDVAIEDLKKAALENESAIDNLELDIQEKAALIEKQGHRITELESDLEDATKPDPDDVVITDDESAAGPGGES